MVENAYSFLLFVGLAFLFGGCDSAHHITGAVTYDGKPVPAGRVVFVPDGQQGNSGAGASGEITAGKYSARLLQDGAYAITVYGHDDGLEQNGPGPEDLFPPYEKHVSIDAETTSLDFDVPPKD